MKRTSLLLAAFCCAVMGWAQNNVITYKAPQKLNETTSVTAEGLHTNAFNATIASHTFSAGVGTITFADELNIVGSSAFRGCWRMTSVNLPKTVKEIKDNAFLECSALGLFTCPDSLQKIGANAFSKCYGMTSLKMNDNLHTIDQEAFSMCTGFTSVVIFNSVLNIGENAFQYVNNVQYGGNAKGSPWGAKCRNGVVDIYAVYSDATKTKLVGYSTVQTGKVDIAETVTTIGKNAFYSFTNLEHIELPAVVTTIEDDAFNGCNNLTAIILPKSVSSLGVRAFYGCSGLSKIVSFNTSAPTCGANCFVNIPNTIPVYVPDKNVNKYKAADGWKDFTNILATKKYNIKIAGVNITNASSSDVLNDGTVSYNHDAKSLTLNKANLGSDSACVLETEYNLSVHCTGDNSLTYMGDNGNSFYANDYNITFTGEGNISLTTYCSWNAIQCNNLTIEKGCEFNAQSEASAISLNGTLKVDSAYLFALGNNNTATIRGCNNLVMENGVAITSAHTFDSKYGEFRNANNQEAKDNISIGIVPSGIQQITFDTKQIESRKVMVDGQLMIIHQGKIYDSLGGVVK